MCFGLKGRASSAPANGRGGGPTERAAPCYGEDSDYVYDELLKLTKKEKAELEKEGVI